MPFRLDLPRFQFLLPLFLALLPGSGLEGQEMERVDLSRGWRMLAADDTLVRVPREPDRQGWVEVSLTDTWRSLELEGFQGTVWFHRSVPLPEGHPPLALLLGPTRHGWARLFADGLLIGEIGSSDQPFPHPIPRVFPLGEERRGGQSLELTLEFHRIGWASDEVAETDGPVEGAVILGGEEDLRTYKELLRDRSLLGDLYSLGFGVMFLFVGLYHLQLYGRRRSQSGYFWFGLGAIAFSANAILLSAWIPYFTPELTLPYRLTDASGHLATAFLLGFLWAALDRPPPSMLRWYQWSHPVLAILLVLVPFQWVWASAMPRFLWLLPALAVGVLWVVRGVREGHPEAPPLLAGGVCLVVCEVGELLRVAGLPLPTILPNLGFLALTVSMVVSLSNRFSRVHEELDLLRRDLESRVAERTQSLTEVVRAMEEQSAAKSRFLAHMSHELRTPLNAIIGFANVLKKDAEALGERKARLTERISASGVHLLGIVEELLDLSKIEAGKMRMSIEAHDLAEIVAVAAAQLEGAAHEKGLEMRTRIPTGLSPTQLDRQRLMQILTNLIGNAIKFTEEGWVEVRVLSKGDRAVAVEVEDTGMGIPEDAMPHIFEAYEQTHVPHTRKVEGTGLGLAISRSLAQLMGFSLRVESTVGEGSVFRLDLRPPPPTGS